MLNEMKLNPYWVIWKYETIDGKQTKVPYSALDGYRVSTSLAKGDDVKARWATFDKAKQAQETFDASGIGYVLTGLDEIVCIDLDDSIVDGEVLAYAKSYMAIFNTYAEISPSGNGLRLIAHSTVSLPNRRDKHIEIYTRDRYMTVTQNVLRNLPIRDCTKELVATIEAFPAKASGHSGASTVDVSSLVKKQPISERTRPIWGKVRQTTSTFTRDLFLGKAGFNNAKHPERNPDHSNRDLCLCRTLAYYTRGDKALIKEMLMQTDFIREKWFRPYQNQTWIDALIDDGIQQYRDRK